MKFVIYLIGLVMAFLFGCLLEPRMRLALTGIVSADDPAAMAAQKIDSSDAATLQVERPEPGSDVLQAPIANGSELIGAMTSKICFSNARDFFRLELHPDYAG